MREPLDLGPINARLAAPMAAGPWHFNEVEGTIRDSGGVLIAINVRRNHGPFLAASEQDVLALAAEVERLREIESHEKETLRRLLRCIGERMDLQQRVDRLVKIEAAAKAVTMEWDHGTSYASELERQLLEALNGP